MTPFRGPSMDVGTAYEMGAGAALGKIVVGYTTDGAEAYCEKVRKVHTLKRSEDGHLRDETGMSVEEFGVQEGRGLMDNLMLSCGVQRLCLSEEEGVAAIAELLKGKRA